LFSDAQEVTVHRKAATVTPKDVELVRVLRGETQSRAVNWSIGTAKGYNPNKSSADRVQEMFENDPKAYARYDRAFTMHTFVKEIPHNQNLQLLPLQHLLFVCQQNKVHQQNNRVQQKNKKKVFGSTCAPCNPY
jgi:hypothetical protein